jgi:hypothetical protein
LSHHLGQFSRIGTIKQIHLLDFNRQLIKFGGRETVLLVEEPEMDVHLFGVINELLI